MDKTLLDAHPTLMSYATIFAWLGVGLAVLGALLFLFRHRRFGSRPKHSLEVSPTETGRLPNRSRQALVDKAPRSGLERIQADVRRFGWHGVRVKGRDGSGGYLYTVGLWHTYRHPEIVLFAPEEDPSGMLKPLQRVCQAVSQDEVFEAEQTHPKLFDNFPGVFGLVDSTWYDHYLGAAVGFYGEAGFPALQLFWPDRHGLFPWEDDCAPPVKAWQPLLFEDAPPELVHAQKLRAEAAQAEAKRADLEPADREASRQGFDDGLRLRASDLFADLSEIDPGRLMKDWLWLTGEELSPLQVTIFGDVFLTSSPEGPVYFLDTGRGALLEAAPDKRAWKNRLSDPPTEWFHTGVLMALLENERRPGAGKVFSWKVPLSAGGTEDVENVGVADARLHLGQTSRAALAAQG